MLPVHSARSNNRGGDDGRWHGWPVFFLLFTLDAGISPCPALAGSPGVDGTPTKSTITNVSSFATSFPAGFGSANAGDCCMILYCGSHALSTAAGCAQSGSGWAPYTFPNWNNTFTAEILTHVFSNGDTAPTCKLTASAYGSENLLCYKSSNGCGFAAGPTPQNTDTASVTVSGPGIVGTAGDAHLFFTCNHGTATLSNYNDSLAQEVTQSYAYSTTAEADAVIGSSGQQPTAKATISVSSPWCKWSALRSCRWW